MFVFFCVNVCLLPNQFNYAYPVELGLDQDNMIDRKDGAKILKTYGLRKEEFVEMTEFRRPSPVPLH